MKPIQPPRIATLLALAAALLAPARVTHAGLPGGPYIVWVNFGTRNPAVADDAIRAALDSDQPGKPCWNGDALLYMRKRPPGVTDELVRRALLGHDTKARASLRALLKKPFDEVPAFDGVVAYTDVVVPTLVSMNARGQVRSEPVPATAFGGGETAWLPTFCDVLPPIDHPA